MIIFVEKIFFLQISFIKIQKISKNKSKIEKIFIKI